MLRRFELYNVFTMTGQGGPDDGDREDYVEEEPVRQAGLGRGDQKVPHHKDRVPVRTHAYAHGVQPKGRCQVPMVPNYATILAVI